jgi:hypothetical protein
VEVVETVDDATTGRRAAKLVSMVLCCVCVFLEMRNCHGRGW